jgi:UDP-N-acetylmuramyl pentapeptide phosphotransferase/UDP-N-acetylglucosamine-1-phosphate transferase
LAKLGLILAVVLSFVLGLLFTPLVRGMAARLRICEKPNGRTSREIAHIGGVGIIGAILFTLLPLFMFFLPTDPIVQAFIPVLIASGFLVFLLGIIDDLRSLHYIYKLILQVAVSIFVSAVGLALLMHFGALRVAVYLIMPLFLAIAVWMLVVSRLSRRLRSPSPGG